MVRRLAGGLLQSSVVEEAFHVVKLPQLSQEGDVGIRLRNLSFYRVLSRDPFVFGVQNQGVLNQFQH